MFGCVIEKWKEGIKILDNNSIYIGKRINGLKIF